jgi:hypothetical protein
MNIWMQVARQEQELAAAYKASDRVTQGLVHQMLMELETGGNIRSASSCTRVSTLNIVALSISGYMLSMYICVGASIHIA